MTEVRSDDLIRDKENGLTPQTVSIRWGPMAITTAKLIRVGHSPDPDDAFMFYALAKEKIPMRGFRVKHVIEDIESLNQRALRAELEVTAISCHAYAYLSDQYLVMRSGASVGDQYGPIVVGTQQACDHGPLLSRKKI